MTNTGLCVDNPKTTIREALRNQAETTLFGTAFLAVYGDKDWVCDLPNRTAAHQFRTQLISRVATARLPYGIGIERSALKSIVDLFESARKATSENLGCGTFEVVVWHTLNSHVRPFTAKWHPLSASGALDALDSSDDFRTELYHIQFILRELERGLALLQGNETGFDPFLTVPPKSASDVLPDAQWRPAGNLDSFRDAERKAVQKRRAHYNIDRDDWAAGLALSGGGIRSATFSLGVLAALGRRNMLPEFDYLSTVSGGGYAGCFLTSLLGRDACEDSYGLRSDQEPFRREEQESEILMGVRQRASFLTGGFFERLLIVMRTSYGIFGNVVILFAAFAVFAAFETLCRAAFEMVGSPAALGWIFPVLALVLLKFVARTERFQLAELRTRHFFLACVFLTPIIWVFLGLTHQGLSWLTGGIVSGLKIGSFTAAILTVAILMALLGAVCSLYAGLRGLFGLAATLAILLIVEHAFFVLFADKLWTEIVTILIVALSGIVVLWLITDVNDTSLHRYYRSKLASAFIHDDMKGSQPQIGDFNPQRALYPIINCALNAPGSTDAKMRGRGADVFSFTPHMTGSNLIGYQSTRDWEALNPQLDLAAAMALSGAAVSPQTGLTTTRIGSLWLTLVNARLNAWLRKPVGLKPWIPGGPGLEYVVREFTSTVSERTPYTNISDGGHIENLGVYELLKRRCRYIVAIDGEADPRMTFHALTNLQRLAYIDMGVHIDADLDELRLLETGFSRSHFRFCQIRYPTVSETGFEVGYLLYVKLSLTGNEGEFLRRYRLDEPSFPHHSTADQFFTETQFEAYRSLGEHIGDKLFMEAVIDDLGKDKALDVEALMKKYAESFLGRIYEVASHAEYPQGPNDQS